VNRSAAIAAMPLESSYAPASRWTLFAIVFGAMSFNLWLCFANTHFMGVGNIHVIASEILIISAAFLVAYPSIERIHLILLGCVVLWALMLASIRVAIGTDDVIDIKIARDLMIPVAFFLLGTRVRDMKTADFIVKIAAAAVLIVALFEYFALDLYIKMFSVAKYYIARGTMEARQALQSSDLFVSGMRPAGAQGGRNLLSFLGDHRVSSMFLEPVSLGNFGFIVFMIGLVRSKFGDKLQIGLLLTGMALVILPDSRFGAYLCMLALVVMLLPVQLATLATVAMPLVALAMLTLVPMIVTGSYDPQNRYVDNGFVGRFVLSGQILGDFDVLTWMGLKALRIPAFDSGYAYIIGGVGMAGLLAAWGIVYAIRSPDRQFETFRNMTALYYGTILCVSNSPFTIKTASLLWFFLGALYATGRQASVSARSDTRYHTA
jgi:putative polymerase